MSNKYYIHKQDAWDKIDRDEIEAYFREHGYEHSIEAARGLGAGGPGWEVPIEIALQISGVVGLGDQIWKVVKFLLKRRPKKQAPDSQPEIYQLIVHIDSRPSIVINLNESEVSTKKAVDKLDGIEFDKYYRIIQDKDNWKKF